METAPGRSPALARPLDAGGSRCGVLVNPHDGALWAEEARLGERFAHHWCPAEPALRRRCPGPLLAPPRS